MTAVAARRRGSTLIEAVVALGLSVLAIGLALDAFARSLAAAGSAAHAALAPARAADAADAIARDLRDASAVTVVCASDASVRFAPVTGYDSTAGVTLGPEVSFDLDGDVLRRRTHDGGAVTSEVHLARGLAGLVFTRHPDGRVTVFVAVPADARDGTAPVTSRSVSLTVLPRNP